MAFAMSRVDIEIVEGDLLDQDVDVIVNAWNRNIIPWWLLLPQGVSGAIKRRAGKAPFREVGGHGAIPLGGAVMTSAGKLPFKAIIHVAGINMLWRASAAYRLVKDRQQKVSLNLLWELVAGLQSKDWRQLDEAAKNRLRKEAEK